MKTKSQQSELLKEAAKWRLLSLFFECPGGDWFAQVTDLAAEVDDVELKQAAEYARKEAGEGLYHAIFGPGGPAPPREVTYRSWVQPGYLLSELSSFYNAFSYEPKTHETPDHIAVETGFVAYLRLKELYALECGDTENAEITAKASQTFLDDHLSKYAEKIAKLLAASQIEYLELAGRALFNNVGLDKDEGKQIYLPVLYEESESTYECGAASF